MLLSQTLMSLSLEVAVELDLQEEEEVLEEFEISSPRLSLSATPIP
jgi:hypothetical protein